MPEGGPVPIAVICEDEPDRRVACDLADRVLCSRVEWIEPQVLDSYRSWHGAQSPFAFLKLSRVWELAKDQNIKVLGHFNEQPGEPDSRVAKAAFLLLVAANPLPQVVFFVRDTDNELDREKGWTQARDSRSWPFTIIVGMQHTKRECWILAGYAPRNDSENASLSNLRQELGFNPTTHSHMLTAKNDQAKNSAKRALRILADDNPNREQSCWQETPLEVLKTNGSGNGLKDFLEEIETRLVPLFPPAGNHP